MFVFLSSRRIVEMLYFNGPFLQNSKYVYLNVRHFIAPIVTVELHVQIQIVLITIVLFFLTFPCAQH